METPKGDRSSNLTPRKPQTPFSAPTTIVSARVKSVFLHDWWLLKLDGKGLAIGGFASRASLGVRIFSSAAISKRHCATILETTDGITITIAGLINISRTYQNGFPAKVCNQFLHGFPYNWEEYAAGCLGKESTESEKTGNNLPVSLNDLPVTTIRDLLRSTFGNSNYDLLVEKIYNDTLRTSKKETRENSGAPMDSNLESKSSASSGKSGINEKKGKTNKSSRQLAKNASAPRLGVSTRSMSRMKLRKFI